MTPDTSNTEHDAAHFAAIAGASEHVGSPVGDQEPDVAWAKALGVDPWDEHICPACGEREEQMPARCRNCNWRNWGPK
jgi:hypothetical protein